MPNKAKALPRLSRLQELFDYEAKTGDIRWKVQIPHSRKSPGDLAGCVNKAHGYIDIKLDGQSFPSHRLAWLFATGQDPAECAGLL